LSVRPHPSPAAASLCSGRGFRCLALLIVHVLAAVSSAWWPLLGLLLAALEGWVRWQSSDPSALISVRLIPAVHSPRKPSACLPAQSPALPVSLHSGQQCADSSGGSGSRPRIGAEECCPFPAALALPSASAPRRRPQSETCHPVLRAKGGCACSLLQQLDLSRGVPFCACSAVQ
jgi:hypothetical protein